MNDNVGQLRNYELACAGSGALVPGVWKIREQLQRTSDFGTDAARRGRIAFANVARDCIEMPPGLRRDAGRHLPNLAHVASISSSVANSPRAASARPISRSASCSGVS